MLLDYLKKIPDHRRAQGQCYKLADVLFVSILAILSRADSYRDIGSIFERAFKKIKHIIGAKLEACAFKITVK